MADGSKYALSTMWSQQERFTDLREFARAAQAMGYDGIEASHVTDQEGLQRLIDAAQPPLTSIHAPAPRETIDGKLNGNLNLAALDDEERRIAIEHTKRSIDYAARAGARYVVVHLGGIGDEMLDSELKHRRLFDSGTQDGPEIDALRSETLERRAELAPPYLERARATLAELVAYAGPREVALGLENRLHYHEFPLPDETLSLLGDYSAHQAGYWHDVGHAEVQWRLGFVDKRAWLDTLSARTLGCHLHDVDGLGDHRAPGNGDVEWDYIAGGLPADALRVFEINQHQPDEAVAGAVSFLRERRVVT